MAGAIATPDIPLEADRLLTVLRGLEERVAPTPPVLAIEALLPEMAQRISDAQLETKGQLAAASSLTVLTNLADLWSGMQGELKTWADRLRVRATDVGTVIDQLEELAATWTRTREEARRTQAPPALIKRVDEALAAIAGRGRRDPVPAARRDAAFPAARPRSVAFRAPAASLGSPLMSANRRLTEPREIGPIAISRP